MSFSLVLNNNNEYFILPDIAYKKKRIQIIDTIARSGFFFCSCSSRAGRTWKAFSEKLFKSGSQVS